MNSARKDGRSFGKARTFDSRKRQKPFVLPFLLLLDTRISGLSRFLRNGSITEQRKARQAAKLMIMFQTVDTPFQEMNGESMAYWLGKFVQEVVRRDGQKYPPRSLYGIVRYLDEKNARFIGVKPFG
jgi:hypothetical protein